jgi:hypothetical protein
MTHSSDSTKDCVLAWDAMPGALQGNLTQQQGEWLDNHLAGCDPCREQFAQQQRLQRAMMLPVSLPIDESADLQRLLARIDHPEMPRARDSLRSGGWAGRALAAAVVAQAIGLGVLGTKLWSMDSAPAYRTLSQEVAPVPRGSIRLVPDPSMNMADWDELLHAHGLQVVAGPNEVGGYTVVPLSELAKRDALLQRLRANGGIRFAEPVANAP